MAWENQYIIYYWTCGSCGAFVPNNISHTCPTRGSRTVGGYVDARTDEAKILERLNRLERKVDKLLKALNAR